MVSCAWPWARLPDLTPPSSWLAFRSAGQRQLLFVAKEAGLLLRKGQLSPRRGGVGKPGRHQSGWLPWQTCPLCKNFGEKSPKDPRMQGVEADLSLVPDHPLSEPGTCLPG